MTTKSVLFLCIGNSCRNQIAEDLINHFAGDRWEANFAGTEPGYVHLLVIRAMPELGIDISKNRSKSAAEIVLFGLVSMFCAVRDKIQAQILSYLV